MTYFLIMGDWNPLNISGTAKATNFELGVRIDYNKYYSKMQNYGT